MQVRVVGEGRALQSDCFGELHRLETGAVGEGSDAHIDHLLWQIDRDQSRPSEGVISDAGEGIRERKVSQGGAACEGRHTNRLESAAAVIQAHFLQGHAIVECQNSNRLNRRRDGNGQQIGGAGKCILFDRYD